MTTLRCKICGGSLDLFEADLFDDRFGYPGRFDIYRCGSCGFGQTVPELPEDSISEVYVTYYPRQRMSGPEALQRPVRVFPRWARWWLGVNNTAHYHITPGSRVLDIGCGDGTSVQEINAIGAEGHGIEPDEKVRAVVEALGLNIHIGVFQDLSYPDRWFDFVTLSQVLEHIHRPVELLKEVHRVLKDDGCLIVGVPNVDSRLARKYGSRWLNWHVPYHVNHFSKKSLELLAKGTGFHVRDAKTYTPNLWVEWQEKLLKYPVMEGKRVPLFNPETLCDQSGPVKTRKLEVLERLARRIWYWTGLLLRQMRFIHVLSLRFHDAMGEGESFLVVLEKK